MKIPPLFFKLDHPTGIGDTRGTEQDQYNYENILYTISELSCLHCICILLKPNQQRLTVTFEYCIKMLLANFEKSASKNFVFVFTNCRSTFYRVGESGTLMKNLLNGIKVKPPYVSIPFSKDNMFCMDNEAFRFLVAVNNGIEYLSSSFIEIILTSSIDYIQGIANLKFLRGGFVVERVYLFLG